MGRRNSAAFFESLDGQGFGASVHQHSEFNRPVITTGHWHPENYQAYVHEKMWAMIAERPFLWAAFPWVMFDFSVVKRNEGDRPNLNDKGMITFDRKIKKDAFFFYKANWNPEPMIHITNKRFVERENWLIEVKVYCNSGPVLLSVNGRKITMQPQGYSIHTAKVLLKPGENRVIATAKTADGRMLEDSCTWKLGTR